jgi:hypothetical protein
VIGGKTLSGDSESTFGHPPPGTPGQHFLTAKFEETRGTGIRTVPRLCNYVFTKAGAVPDARRSEALGASTTPTVANDLQRFDGLWLAKVECEKEGVALASSFRFAARIKEGVFHGEKGIEGQPDWSRFDGTISLDGSIELVSQGLTGRDTRFSVNNNPPGLPFTWRASGSFEGSRGSALRAEGRICRLEFTKEESTRGTAPAPAGPVVTRSAEPNGVSRAVNTSPPPAGNRRTRPRARP